jgi:hypothetical protein
VIARFLQVLLAAWAGSLWTICLIVAPSLFAFMQDRHLAGDLAGRFFRIESWLGLVLGGAVLILLSRGIEALRNTTNYALATVTIAAPVSNEIVLRPLMDDARAADNMKLFGILHGAAALLFGFACVTALLLVWRVAAQSEAKRPAE